MSNDQTTNVEKIKETYFYRVSAKDFMTIPGSPLAYWVGEGVLKTFNEPVLSDLILTEGQNKTANNDKYVRFIWEIDHRAVGKGLKWLIYSKGGDYRKWFGNLQHVVDWSSSARLHYRKDSSCRIISEKYWYIDGVTWTDITSGGTGFRYLPKDTTFDMSGPAAFFETSDDIYKYIGLLNSNYTKYLLPVLNPTLHAQLRDIKAIPRLQYAVSNPRCVEVSKSCISLSESDWDSFETSWDFISFPLLNADFCAPTLKASYHTLRAHWREMTLEMQRLEEENNRIFIEAYGLQNELTPDVPLEEVTLTCNPHYRYGNNKSEEELEALLLADTMRDLISYAVGCMFGRYALDKPGLILANQGETAEDYLKQIPEPSFPADDDNVIPMLDGDWFTDDITERFREFLRIAFGEEHYEENLRFVEQALGKDIRKYFLKDFYNDHVRRYKKRPIYWLFSSPKGSFNALIYMHRYQPHTVGTVLEYLRDFKDEKLKARKNHLEAVSISAGASQGDKTKALKEIEKINKILAELDDYERDVLYPLATEQVEIDLDDGVKTNYPKFGEALKKITGLSG